MPEPNTPLAERPWEDVERMLDVESALSIVLEAFAPLPLERLPLLEAAGRVLAEDILARVNVPPFRNSAMDGYAVRAADTAGATWTAPAVLSVSGHVSAGQVANAGVLAGQAVRIMTGAPMPAGADAVVRFEETDEASEAGGANRTTVRVYRPAKGFDNVREAGEDIALGAVVAAKGRVLGPADLGLLASVGQIEPCVHRRPVVAILATGNEIIAPGMSLAGGKVRDSNSIVLGALARSWGADARLMGIATDSVDDLTGRLRAAEDADLIVTSGGVSLGDFDVVKDVLRAQGKVNVWQVRMKPGKPLAFGRIGETPLLGLPGNPVAAAVSFLLFGRPAIRRMMGDTDVAPPMIDVMNGETIDNRGQRRHYVRVRLEPGADGPPLAMPVGEQGAGVLSSLAAADALLVVPESLETAPAGARLSAIPLWR